jgi:hypothetical protein
MLHVGCVSWAVCVCVGRAWGAGGTNWTSCQATFGLDLLLLDIDATAAGVCGRGPHVYWLAPPPPLSPAPCHLTPVYAPSLCERLTHPRCLPAPAVHRGLVHLWRVVLHQRRRQLHVLHWRGHVPVRTLRGSGQVCVCVCVWGLLASHLVGVVGPWWGRERWACDPCDRGVQSQGDVALWFQYPAPSLPCPTATRTRCSV